MTPREMATFIARDGASERDIDVIEQEIIRLIEEGHIRAAVVAPSGALVPVVPKRKRHASGRRTARKHNGC